MTILTIILILNQILLHANTQDVKCFSGQYAFKNILPFSFDKNTSINGEVTYFYNSTQLKTSFINYGSDAFPQVINNTQNRLSNFNILAFSMNRQCALIKTQSYYSSFKIKKQNLNGNNDITFDIVALWFPRISNFTHYYISDNCQQSLFINNTIGGSSLNMFRKGQIQSDPTNLTALVGSSTLVQFQNNTMKFDNQLKFLVIFTTMRIYKLQVYLGKNQYNNYTSTKFTGQNQLIYNTFINISLIEVSGPMNNKLVIYSKNSATNEFRVSFLPSNVTLEELPNSIYYFNATSQPKLTIFPSIGVFLLINSTISIKVIKSDNSISSVDYIDQSLVSSVFFTYEYLYLDEDVLFVINSTQIHYIQFNLTKTPYEVSYNGFYSYDLKTIIKNQLTKSSYANVNFTNLKLVVTYKQQNCNCSKDECQTCDISGQKCILCVFGYAPIAVNGICNKCPDRCDTCKQGISAPICQRCQGNNFLQTDLISNSQCGPCLNIDYCIKCNGTTNLSDLSCGKCQQKFKVNVTNPYQCICDVDDCKTCLQSSCTQCLSGFKLISSSQCLCDVDNCITCQGTHCSGCNQNYTLAQDGLRCVPKCKLGQCLQSDLATYNGILESRQMSEDNQIIVQIVHCPANCYSCRDSLSCDICFNRFSINENLQCQYCNDYCKRCQIKANYKQCRQCLQGYYLNSTNNCKKCMANCIKCNSSSTCQKCNIGMTFNGTQCIQCNKFCISCHQNLTCTEASVGYVLDSSNNLFECLTPCSTCNYSAIHKCLNCSAGYYLNKANQSCILCNENCKTCSNLTTCTSCFTGYETRGKDCTKKCQKSCYQCMQNQPSKCTKCFKNFQLDNNNNCLFMNCQNCENCPSLQYLKDNKCFQCQITDQNCVRCQASQPLKCSECKQKYYLEYSQNDFKCSACNQQCLRCIQAQLCYQCADGYIKRAEETYSQCIKCAQNCETCTVDPYHCTKCKGQFVKQGWKCISSINLGFTLRLDLIFDAFSVTSPFVKLSMVNAIGGDFAGHPQRVSFKTVQDGSVSIFGYVSLYNTTSEQTIQEIYRSLVVQFSSGQLSGVVVLEYGVQRNGAEAPVIDELPAILAGALIPVLLFIIIVIISFFCNRVYRINKEAMIKQRQRKRLSMNEQNIRTEEDRRSLASSIRTLY